MDASLGPQRSSMRRAVLLAGLLLLSAVAPLRAAAPGGRGLPVIPGAQVVPPTAVLGIISGGLSGTYIRVANDISSVFAAKVPGFRVLSIVGQGSLQNMSDVMNIRDVDIGIVQSDVLGYLRQNAAVPGIETQVGYLAKLYDEEVHILARKSVDSVADLTGKTVNVDGRGSGTALTASVIFDALGVKPKLANEDQETALAKLKRGEIDALVYVTGKPARLVSDAGADLHLLAVPLNATLLQTYLPTKFEHADYPNLVADGESVETVAVGAVMAVYNWRPGTERYARLARFVDAFFDNLPDLQTPAHHPKWKQVSMSAQVPGWVRFRAAQQWLDRHDAAAPGHAAAQAPTPPQAPATR